jgi:hypothetical protein
MEDFETLANWISRFTDYVIKNTRCGGGRTSRHDHPRLLVLYHRKNFALLCNSTSLVSGAELECCSNAIGFQGSEKTNHRQSARIAPQKGMGT